MLLRRLPLKGVMRLTRRPDLLEIAKSADCKLSALSPIFPSLIADQPSELMTHLKHELSPHFQAEDASTIVHERSLLESAVLRHWRKSRVTWLRDDICFCQSLLSMASQFMGGPTAFRAQNVGLVAGHSGVQVVFPHAEHIGDQLRVVRRVIIECSSPTLAAIIVMVTLTNAHPFPDGNGRVARVLFNECLRQGGMPSNTYIPFYEIARKADGGYPIRLRQAEIFADWEPIVRFAADVVTLCRELSAQDLRQPND